MSKTYTFHLSEVGGWWSAVCADPLVSGFGDSKEKAIDAAVRSLRSTLRLHARLLARNRHRIVSVVSAGK